MGLWNWSLIAASNATADPSINLREGMAPSQVNDSCRSMMAALAAYRDDVSGTIITGGANTAYTVTTISSMVDDDTDLLPGACVAFIPHATNGANPTLNVDSSGALPLRGVSGVALDAGNLIEGTPYVAVLGPDEDEWLLHGYRNDPALVPIGALAPFVGSAAPNSNFVLPYGQAISRTTYSALFTLCSTTFGVGDGSTTFNIPDLRGRTVFGQDNMGGSTAGRITNAGSGIVGTNRGATGGAETVTLARNNLPNVQIGGTTDTEPDHVHSGDNFSGSNGVSSGGSFSGSFNPGDTDPAGAHSHTITTDYLSGGAASQVPTNKMPPAIILPYIMRVI